MKDKSPEKIDAVVEEFRAFRVSPNHQLPSYNPKEDFAMDYFWPAIAKQKMVTSADLSTISLTYSNLAHLAKVLLVLPHSNANPKRLFSMVGKIETQSRSLLSTSTTCDLLTVKMNHDPFCYFSQDLITDEMLKEAKSATRRSLQKNSDTSTI